MLLRAVFMSPVIIAALFSPAYATNGASGSGSASASASAPPDQNTIAMIGQTRVSEHEIVAGDQAAFDGLQNDHETELHQLQMKYEQARHDLLQKRLDLLLDQQALQAEAKVRGVGTDAVLAQIKVGIVTDDEAHAFYDANQDRIAKPYEQIAPQLKQYLVNQRSEAATRNFYDDLRSKHDIHSRLAPYRLAVAASGPARGRVGAAVTIVEFGDFQCPYCKQAAASMRTILARHPQDVRLVFRNLPLSKIHPNATIAAQAAVCADQQGKFWEMHDAMYEDQNSLAVDGLKQTAARLGLDAARFASCLTDGSSAQVLGADGQAARDLGLTGTPYFFINGRPIDGNVPVEQFDNIVADELKQHSSGLNLIVK
jgi:protein-disulfide isomerase